MKLTPHEEKILRIIKNNPKVVNQPAIRERVAKKYGLTEKTLRNRISELRKRGLLSKKSESINNGSKPFSREGFINKHFLEIWDLYLLSAWEYFSSKDLEIIIVLHLSSLLYKFLVASLSVITKSELAKRKVFFPLYVGLTR